MNNDLTGNLYPPPGFQPEGPIIINPGGEGGTIIIDATPTEGSSNAVASGGVFTELEGKQDFITPVPTEQNPTEYFLDGTKNWRSLIDKVVELYEGIREERGEVTWQDIVGRPTDYITEESDPTVPDYIKNLTQEQTQALAWLTAHFPRTALNPGSVLIVGEDGETITQRAFGEMLSAFFPAVTAIMSGVVSAPSAVRVIQQGFDIRVSWNDITRTEGSYAVEVRAKYNGTWSNWSLIGQPDFSLRQHIWLQPNIPAGTESVGGRVRYINALGQASAWTESAVAYNENEEVITEVIFEIVPGTGRWWTDNMSFESETIYEIVAGTGRWWSEEAVVPVEPVKPNAPVIQVVRINANTVDVRVADTNSGRADTFEFNYREIGTLPWYTLRNDGSLDLSTSSPLLVNQATNNNTWNLTLSISNALFVGKRIEARVRTYVATVASNWSSSASEPSAGGANRIMSARTAKINIQKIDGLWTDTESDTESGKLAYYYVNGQPLKNPDGSRKKFEDMEYRAGLLISVGKVFLDTAFFESWDDFEDTFWMAMIGTSNEGKIGDFAQFHLITS